MSGYNTNDNIVVQTVDQSREVDVTKMPFYAVGNGVVDDWAALQGAFNFAAANFLKAKLPAGTYRTTQTINVVANNVMIEGAGGDLSKIAPDADTYDALVIGPGAAGSGINPSGYLSGICIEGKTSWITGVTAGVKLDGMRQFRVIDVTVRRKPISFDFINNCYGSGLYNCRSNLGGMPLNLRTGSQSGSDLTFDNNWFRGKHGSVCIAPGGGGYHFKNGQLTGGDTLLVDNDDYGVITLGKDYITGAVGTIATVNFDGIDFEGSRCLNQFRQFGQALVSIRDCNFLSTAAAPTAEKPIGIIKAENAVQSRYVLENNAVSGVWKAVKALDIQGIGSHAHVVESPVTSMINGAVTFNGVTNAPEIGLVEQSKLNLGAAFFRSAGASKMVLGGMILRPGTLKTEVSYDWGTTWYTLGQTLSP